MLKSTHPEMHYSKIMEWKTDDEDYQVATAENPELQFLWESILDHFVFGERMAFLTIFLFVITFAIVGNLLTIYITVMR